MFLQDYAPTSKRKYFAEYFACYLRAGNDTEKAADLSLVRFTGEGRLAPCGQLRTGRGSRPKSGHNPFWPGAFIEIS